MRTTSISTHAEKLREARNDAHGYDTVDVQNGKLTFTYSFDGDFGGVNNYNYKRVSYEWEHVIELNVLYDKEKDVYYITFVVSKSEGLTCTCVVKVDVDQLGVVMDWYTTGK